MIWEFVLKGKQFIIVQERCSGSQSIMTGIQKTNKVNAVRVLMPVSTMLQCLNAADMELCQLKGQILVPAGRVPINSCYRISIDMNKDTTAKPILQFRPYSLSENVSHVSIAMVELELDHDVACNRVAFHTIQRGHNAQMAWVNAIKRISDVVNNIKLAQFQNIAAQRPQLPDDWGETTSQLNLPVVLWLRPVHRKRSYSSMQTAGVSSQEH